MNYFDVLGTASGHLHQLKGKTMGVDIARPPSVEYAQYLAKVISKLSPLVGNMIEFSVCNELNQLDWQGKGIWKRQDPGFPDAIFESDLDPMPGIEIKTWFPLATEITARFKDSITFFDKDQTSVALVVWLPEYIIYGKPKIVDVWTGSGRSIAVARDKHYHRPPDYLVLEPEDTSARTANLQQTNTNGYKFQGSSTEFQQAEHLVDSWGEEGRIYDHSPDYQSKVQELRGKYRYRLDTNFAKIDRISHEGLEEFKSKVLQTVIFGHSIETWARLAVDKDSDITDLIKDLI